MISSFTYELIRREKAEMAGFVKDAAESTRQRRNHFSVCECYPLLDNWYVTA